MTCKFHAFMTHTTVSSHSARLRPGFRHGFGALFLAVALVMPAHAERGDRLQKINIAADESGQIDLQNQVVVYTGNVVISRGTMVIRAARVEVRQLPSGYYTAVAFGAANKPATFRQKRDGAGDQWVEGEAERIEYDGKIELVKLFSKARVKRIEGSKPGDVVEGEFISYDSRKEFFSVKNTPTGDSKPGAGRGTMVIQPSGVNAAPAASAPVVK